MADKIRLAFFAEILIEDFDGASRTIHNILKRIPRDTFELLLICGIPPEKQLPDALIQVPVMTIPFNKDYSIALPQLVSFRLQKALETFNPDVIHISTPSLLGTFALKYGEKRQIPVISIYHTHFISYIDYYLRKIKILINPVKNAVIKGQKRFYHARSKVYVPTIAMKTELENMGFDDSNFRVWPRGINMELFSPTKRNVSLLHAITQNTNKNILFCSRLVWEKNLTTLIDIYRLCMDALLPYNFIIIGDGVASADLKKAMPNAFFLGHQNHETLSTLYASADAFIFTSVSESFGNVIIEAQASGLPAIIANGGGSASIIEDGINGFLCTPSDASVYVDALNYIFRDEQVRTSIIEAGLQSVKKYNWENLMSTYLTDIRFLIEQRHNRGVEIADIEFAI
ncbi:MAG: glycosyltransferase family 1 protein [Saprospiraceae bacterium]